MVNKELNQVGIGIFEVMCIRAGENNYALRAAGMSLYIGLFA